LLAGVDDPRDSSGNRAADVRTVGSHEVFANRWLRLREDEIEYADGSPGTYTVVEKQDFALVIPFDGSGFWLVEQFRYPVGSREEEFPQGGWPAGRGGTPAELAAAELAEETGLRADRLEHLGRLFAAYGYSSQSYDVFLATGLTPGEPHRERTEADMVHRRVDEAELRAMVRDGRLRDAHSLAALALFDASRPSRPSP
jgi:8-oxo-dGTP pyrophosphatase MutT (NUDIX family)